MFNRLSRSSVSNPNAPNEIQLSVCECSKKKSNNTAECCAKYGCDSNIQQQQQPFPANRPSQASSKFSQCSRGIELKERLSQRHLHPRQAYGINFSNLYDNCDCTMNKKSSQHIEVAAQCIPAPRQECYNLQSSLPPPYQPQYSHSQYPQQQCAQPVVHQQPACPPGVKYFEIQPPPPPPMQCFEIQPPAPPPIIKYYEESQPCPPALTRCFIGGQEVPCPQPPQQHQPVCATTSMNFQLPPMRSFEAPCPPPSCRSTLTTNNCDPFACVQVHDPAMEVCPPPHKGKKKCRCKKMNKKLEKECYSRKRELVVTKSKAHSINFAEMYNPPGCRHDTPDECCSRKC